MVNIRFGDDSTPTSDHEYSEPHELCLLFVPIWLHK